MWQTPTTLLGLFFPKGAGPHVTVLFCHHTASRQPAAGLAAALLPFFGRLSGIEPLCVASRTERDSQGSPGHVQHPALRGGCPVDALPQPHVNQSWILLPWDV